MDPASSPVSVLPHCTFTKPSSQAHWILGYLIHSKLQHTVVRAIYGFSGTVFGFVLAVTVFEILIFGQEKLGKLVLKKGFQNENPADRSYFNVKINVRFGFYAESNMFSHYAISEISTKKFGPPYWVANTITVAPAVGWRPVVRQVPAIF